LERNHSPKINRRKTVTVRDLFSGGSGGGRFNEAGGEKSTPLTPRKEKGFNALYFGILKKWVGEGEGKPEAGKGERGCRFCRLMA